MSVVPPAVVVYKILSPTKPCRSPPIEKSLVSPFDVILEGAPKVAVESRFPVFE